MKNIRVHGEAPRRIAVVHGGPGAAGEMTPVAKALSPWGVLEPYQTAMSLKGQIDELKSLLETYGDGAVTLIGFSWGAWLSYFLAATEPKLVKKLILIGSAPFEETYVANIRETRFSRMSDRERAEIKKLFSVLDNADSRDRNGALARIGALFSKADAYDAGPSQSETVDYQADIFLGVWSEAAALRSTGQLLTYGQDIRCPVVALHGDYDPHPAAGVEKPLSRVVPDFRFVVLQKCGHKPWVEENARNAFFRTLRKEIKRPDH